MKILIELPSWLGDAIMTTPAIENIVNQFSDVQITLIGSLISIEVLKNHPSVVNSHILDKNFIFLYKTLKTLEEFDIFFSFRNSIRAKFIKFFISSNNKYQFDKTKYNKIHQVEQYTNFVNDCL